MERNVRPAALPEAAAEPKVPCYPQMLVMVATSAMLVLLLPAPPAHGAHDKSTQGSGIVHSDTTKGPYRDIVVENPLVEFLIREKSAADDGRRFRTWKVTDPKTQATEMKANYEWTRFLIGEKTTPHSRYSFVPSAAGLNTRSCFPPALQSWVGSRLDLLKAKAKSAWVRQGIRMSRTSRSRVSRRSTAHSQ